MGGGGREGGKDDERRNRDLGGEMKREGRLGGRVWGTSESEGGQGMSGVD